MLIVASIIALYAFALYSAARAILHTRTAQGAMAWVLGLLLLPFLMVPLYWVFGRTKFHGYVGRRQRIMARAGRHLDALERLDAHLQEPPGRFAELHTLARRLGAGGFTGGNRVELLIDGEATYAAMLAAIAAAQHDVLVEFYIFRDDDIGRRFRDALVERARHGVQVYLLHDPVGARLGRAFLCSLDESGVRCHSFDPGRKGSRLQINFRNHRKIVVVDGAIAFVGGLNVGDDYLGKDPVMGRWRDTHLRIDGPAAVQAHLAFCKDWYWATDELPDAPLRVVPALGDARVLVWHTGPSDPQPECLLAWLELIGRARERIWIASPYFVPPDPIQQALRLALVRGVEVQLLVPGKNDNRMVDLASQVHLAELASCGAAIHRWRDGFMHQKVCLVDSELAMVGTTNLDNRSIFINFEIFALSDDAGLVDDVARMLEADFAAAERISLDEFRNASYLRRLSCRAANLFAPML